MKQKDEVVAVAEWRKPGRRRSDADPESQGDQHGSAGAAASLGGMFFWCHWQTAQCNIAVMP